jgi:outer membrane protein assembly factor BamB
MVFLRMERTPLACGLAGAVRWRVSTGNYLIGSPCVDKNNVLYFPSYDKQLYAIDGATGAVRWTFATKGSISGSPAIGAAGVILVGSGDGTMYALKGGSSPRLTNWVVLPPVP